MALEAWYEAFGSGTSDLAETLREALERMGITLCPRVRDAPVRPGIVLFEEMNRHLSETLGRASRGGQNRVLVIAARPEALPSHGPWQLLHAGAADVLVWDPAPGFAVGVARRLERWAAVDQCLASPAVQDEIVGRSPVWLSLIREIIEVARFTDAPVLLLGESGTGKELLARLIHQLDARPKERELVVLDCTTIVPDLSGSEFFGHERGAFTGAVAPRDGAFALANGGTLFLDEIGELPLALQGQLLRIIQEHTYKRVGGNAWQRTEFRLVCATNRDLMGQIAAGEFRADLYYRIAAYTCKLPPLRERPEDILPLFRHFVRQMRPDGNPADPSDPVRDYLMGQQYPGNIRELKQLASRILCRHVGSGPITVGSIPQGERRAAETGAGDWYDAHFDRAIRRALALGIGLKEIGRVATETAIGIAVEAEGGNLQRAAAKLGVTDRALQMRQANRRVSH